MYCLNSGIVLHTFAHGLPFDTDAYPSAFLSRGFAFFGATADGTVTLWDVNAGDVLQSVQHLRASMPSLLTSVLIFYKRVLPSMQLQYVLPLQPTTPTTPLRDTSGNKPTLLFSGLHGREERYYAPCNSI
jgi:hypothetical protein